MTTAGLLRHLRRQPLLDIGLVILASADAVGSLLADDDHRVTVFRASISAVAVLALLLRERAPYLSFVLAVPALAITDVDIASMIALFTVARWIGNSSVAPSQNSSATPHYGTPSTKASSR